MRVYKGKDDYVSTKSLDEPPVKNIFRMLDPFPLNDLAVTRMSTKRTSGLYVLSHMSKRLQNPVPIYVGMGIDIFERLERHIGAILAGDFCLWDVDDETLVGCTGLACEYKDKDSSVLYIPEALPTHVDQNLAQRARLFLEKTQVVVLKAEPDVDRKLLYCFEGSLVRFLSNNQRAKGSYLLANGDRSSRSLVHFVLSNDPTSLPKYLIEYLEFSEKQG